MRPQFTEHKVLAAADLEDEREYLDRADAIHLALAHGAAGRDLVAATIAHPAGHATFRLGRPGSDALTVDVADAGGGHSELLRVAESPSLPPEPQLAFGAPAAAPATGPRPGTVSLLGAVGRPAATELRIEAPAGAGPATGPVFAFRYGGALVRRPLSVGADGTVEVMDLKVKGALALGPAPAPPAATPSDPTGAVAAAEALREQLAQGLGIGDDTGIAVAITNPVVGPGRVEFTIEVADAEGVGPVTVTIRGRVNVGTTLVDDGLGLLPASLPRGQILRRAIDVSVAANVKGDVIVAVTAYGIHPQAGLVSASVARLLGTIV